MVRKITVRLPEDLAEWLDKWARETGVPASRIVCEQLRRAKVEQESKPYMRYAGAIKGPRDLSTRKGYSRN